MKRAAWKVIAAGPFKYAYLISILIGGLLGGVLTFALKAYAESAEVGPEQVFQWMPPEVRAVAFLVTGIGLGLFLVVALAIKFIVQPSKEGAGDRLDSRLDRLETRLDKLDDRIDGRFNGFDERFTDFERDLRRLLRQNGTSTGSA